MILSDSTISQAYKSLADTKAVLCHMRDRLKSSPADYDHPGLIDFFDAEIAENDKAFAELTELIGAFTEKGFGSYAEVVVKEMGS
jgi:hypothetical protein